MKLDKSLKIHHGSCATFKWPAGTRWNYVWHDIWSTISPQNLRQADGEAEHGISYELMHRKFQNRCDRQASWAFPMAKKMDEIQKYCDHMASIWTAAWNMSTEEERVDMLVDINMRSGMPMSITKEQWIEFMDMPGNEGGNHLMAAIRKRAARKMDLEEAIIITDPISRRYAMARRGMLART
jgi:hypothetical protein